MPLLNNLGAHRAQLDIDSALVEIVPNLCTGRAYKELAIRPIFTEVNWRGYVQI